MVILLFGRCLKLPSPTKARQRVQKGHDSCIFLFLGSQASKLSIFAGLARERSSPWLRMRDAFALTRLKGQAPKPRGFVVDTAEALTRADRHTAQNFQENRNGGHLYGTTLSSEKEQEPIQYP
jgi:hypothetical protein